MRYRVEGYRLEVAREGGWWRVAMWSELGPVVPLWRFEGRGATAAFRLRDGSVVYVHLPDMRVERCWGDVCRPLEREREV